jgi:NAD-dependent deacetylase
VFTGAGLSKESGISTFRGEGGIWSKFFNISLVYFGTPFGWKLTPGISWSCYLKYFLKPIVEAKPNNGHKAIAEMEQLFKSKIENDNNNSCGGDNEGTFAVITQNVDALHQSAGSSSETVYELHGTVFRHKCSKHGHPHPHVISRDAMENDSFLSDNSPQCATEGCHSYLRPDCVLFTENLPEDTWNSASKKVRQLKRGDCMIVVGTSGVVYPAASLPEMAMTKEGVYCIEVNPFASQYSSYVSAFLQGPAGEVLPLLLKNMRDEMVQQLLLHSVNA